MVFGILFILLGISDTEVTIIPLKLIKLQSFTHIQLASDLFDIYLLNTVHRQSISLSTFT